MLLRCLGVCWLVVSVGGSLELSATQSFGVLATGFRIAVLFQRGYGGFSFFSRGLRAIGGFAGALLVA